MTQNLAIQFHVLTATRVGSGCLPRLYCQWSWRVVLVRLSVLESIHLQAHCCFGQIHGKLSLIFFFSSGLYRTSARLPGICPTVVASCSLPFVFIIFTTIALCECALEGSGMQLQTSLNHYITYINWPLPRRGFSGPIYKRVIYGWDQTLAYTGAACSRYQSISDLTQHINEWNAAWPQHRELCSDSR